MRAVYNHPSNGIVLLLITEPSRVRGILSSSSGTHDHDFDVKVVRRSLRDRRYAHGAAVTYGLLVLLPGLLQSSTDSKEVPSCGGGCSLSV